MKMVALPGGRGARGEGVTRTSAIPRFRYNCSRRAVAQVVARFLGVEEVAGSSPAGPTSPGAGFANRVQPFCEPGGTPVGHRNRNGPRLGETGAERGD